MDETHDSGSGGRPSVARESVWGYPPRPRIEPTRRRARVVFAAFAIADTRRALRVLERGHPPLYYIPSADVRREHLEATSLSTWCESKGMASYFDVRVGDRRAATAAWHHPWPKAGYEELAGYVAFNPSKMDACYVDDEQVRVREGDSYGGWITSDIEDPAGGGPREGAFGARGR